MDDLLLREKERSAKSDRNQKYCRKGARRKGGREEELGKTGMGRSDRKRVRREGRREIN